MNRALEHFNAIGKENDALEIDKAIALTKLDPEAVSFDDLSNLIDKNEMDEATKEAAKIEAEKTDTSEGTGDLANTEQNDVDSTDEVTDSEQTTQDTSNESVGDDDELKDVEVAQEAIDARFEFIRYSLEKLEEVKAVSDKIEIGISNGGVSMESYTSLKSNLKTIYTDLGVDDKLIESTTSTEGYSSFSRRVKVSKEAIEEIKAMISRIWQAIVNAIKSLANWISKAIKSFLSEFRQAKSDLLKITQALQKLNDDGDSAALNNLRISFTGGKYVICDLNKTELSEITKNQTQFQKLIESYLQHLHKSNHDIVKFSEIPDTLDKMHFPVTKTSHPSVMTAITVQPGWFSSVPKGTVVYGTGVMLGNKRMVALIPNTSIVISGYETDASLSATSQRAKDRADENYIAALRSFIGFKNDISANGTDAEKLELPVMGRKELSQYAVDTAVLIKSLDSLVVQFGKQEKIIKDLQAFANMNANSTDKNNVGNSDDARIQFARRYRELSALLTSFYIEPTFQLIRLGKTYLNASNEYCLRCIKSYL